MKQQKIDYKAERAADQRARGAEKAELKDKVKEMKEKLMKCAASASDAKAKFRAWRQKHADHEFTQASTHILIVF